MATAKSNRRRTVSIQRTEAFDRDLATIMRTGMTQSDAIRFAAEFVAHGYQSAWEAGAVPDGQHPSHMLMKVRASHSQQGDDQRV
ncbi:hypothetical protein [Streptomyces sp. NBC_01180]|uniref:hypothetical protein n=1 Tax=Streptomyces sp. NBC_01180 TaxID=2903763 RepID=UPI00386C8A61|nr:hypothetical protein OG708_17710 [Streptomyces sp. NBC_01180]